MLMVAERGRRRSCAVHRTPGRTGRLIVTFEAPHGSIAAFDAPVVLLQPVIQVATGPVPHALPSSVRIARG